MRTRLMVAAGLTAGLLAALAPAVYAAPGGGMGPEGMTGAVGPAESRGIANGKGALDWACVRDCGDYTLTCRRTVEESGRLCTQARCNDEIQTAREVCNATPRAIACRQAQLAVRQCALNCLEAAVGENSSCRRAEVACLRSCPPSANLRSKDPACVGDCAGTYTGCLKDADESAADCNALCSADATTEYDCRAQCDDTLQAARRVCMRDAQSCVAQCDEVNPPSTTATGQ
ncbi:MAG: hypothetical protein U0587_21565 [Candidatus Binatia bacterium]